MTYTEDALVEQPAIKLFDELGWDTLNCLEEGFGDGSLLGRENHGDIVLINRLRPALVKLNPDSPELVIDEAVDSLTRDFSVMSSLVL